jgi:hypothetical protein
VGIDIADIGREAIFQTTTRRDPGDPDHSAANGRSDYNSVSSSFYPLTNVELPERRGILMTERQNNLCARLQRLGFTKENQREPKRTKENQREPNEAVWEVFEVVSESILMADNVVLVDATEKKSGLCRRVRIPLPIVKVASTA